MIYRKIPAYMAGLGAYSPSRVITNEEISPGDGRTLERLLGVKERRGAAEDEACSDLIVTAAQKVLESAGVSPLELDRIIVSATPGDFFEPTTASVVQTKLGAQCPAIDVKMSCVGWLAGVDLALRCVATGEKNVLVMAGTIVSKGDVFKRPLHRAIFGDGAGGCLISATDNGTARFLSGALWTDGQFFAKINLPHPGSLHPQEIPEEFRGKFYMGPQRIFFDTLGAVTPVFIGSVLKEAEVAREDLDLVVLHQPSRPLFEVALKALDVPREKVVDNFETQGNTISAELPIALDRYVREGRIKRGDTILLATFGAGFNAGATVMEY
ncbi:MAG: ketoacyl-ACP synthase III [Candidatus Rokubacteria bacterium]|nr:ketoacyl-ACP synthase III [Candidatus Rokubacteria bacterium]